MASQIKVNVGDLVSPTYDSPENPIGLILNLPETTQDGEEVVLVDWLGWNLRENYSVDYLKVISGSKMNENDQRRNQRLGRNIC